MRLFGSRAPVDADAQRRQEASRQSLEQGGLPLNAQDRLREQAERQGTPRHFFTSDLGVNELGLCHHAGYSPLGQVMGSSVYHVGWQPQPMYSFASGELTVLTQAFYQARHLALGRLRQEAALLGASGVVGVRLEHKTYEWGLGLLEFAAVGTAIRETDAPAGHDAPFLSDLSGQEFWTLRQAGFRPAGIAVGNCTYYQVPSWGSRQAMTGFFSAFVNQEMPEFTQALYNARELAMQRMADEARSAGALGVIGADVSVTMETREVDTGNDTHRTDMIFHYTAIGTAITAGPAPTGPLPLRSTLRIGA